MLTSHKFNTDIKNTKLGVNGNNILPLEYM